MKKGIVWLKLDNISKENLRRAYPPRYENIFYDHVTLAYDVTQSDFKQFIGRQETIEAFAHAYDAQVQAVRVTTAGLPDTYGVPHVTLSAAKGIEPFASVSMLQAEHKETAIEPALTLTGYIEFVDL